MLLTSETPPASVDQAKYSRYQGASFLLLVTIVIFAPLIEGGTTHVAAMILRLLLLSLLAVYWTTSVREGRLRWPHLSIDSHVAIYLALALMWTLCSSYVNQSIQWLMVLMGYATILYLTVWVLDRSSRIKQILFVLILMGIVESCLALYQHVGLGQLRPAGTFFNPNFLAGYLAAIVMIILARLCYSNWSWQDIPRKRQRQIWEAARLGLVVMVFITGITLTGSRGGMLALVVGIGVVAVTRVGWRGVVVAALCGILILALPNPVRDRVFQEYRTNPESYARIQIWQAALSEIRDHPLGIGLGLYQYTYPRYAFPIDDQVFRYGKVAQTPHSEFLQMAVELGVVSLIGFGIGTLRIVRAAQNLLCCRVRRSMRSLLVGCLAGIAVILTQAGVDANLHEPGIVIVLVVFVAIIFACQRELVPERRKDFTIHLRARTLWLTMGVLVVGALGLQVMRLGAAYVVYNSGSEFMRRGAIESAIERYQQATALDSGKALYHSALGSAYLSSFQRDGSEEAGRRMVKEFQEALDLNPLDGRLAGILAGAYVTLAEVPRPGTPNLPLRRNQWVMKAIELLERASEEEPFAFIHPFQRAHLHLQLGQTRQAQMMIRRVLEIEPNYLPARELLIQVCLSIGCSDTAKREYAQIVTRQLLYGPTVRDAREARFLQVDIDKIRSQFDQAGVPIS